MNTYDVGALDIKKNISVCTDNNLHDNIVQETTLY